MTDTKNIIDCPNATAPVNIAMNKVTGPCSLLCSYNHKYGIYSPNVTNKKSYLSLNYSGKTNPVTYNNVNYNVNEIRIYQPSLHKYNGLLADGEILIIHGGSGKNLIVSIPFKVGSKTDKGSVQLSSILEESALRTPNEKESVTLTLGDFSLDNFIPDKKPFLSYSGTLPYSPCNGSYSYIVYDITNALNITNNLSKKLQKIIQYTSVEIKTANLFYNKQGANANKSDNAEIYIDCQPVNEEGELLVKENTSSDNNNSNTIDLSEIEPFLYVIAGICIASGIVYGSRYIFKKMRKE